MSLHTVAGRAFALALALLGIALLLGGIRLITVGGSWWYALSGGTLVVSAILLWRGSRWGAWLYGAMLICTVVWSIGEVGFNLWALAPRLGLLAVLGLWFLTPLGRYGARSGPYGTRIRLWTALGITLGVFVILGIVWGRSAVGAHGGAAVTAVASGGAGNAATAGDWPGDWRNYGNDRAGTRFSQLAQIRPDNVERLKLAWSFSTGDLARPGQNYDFEATPLKVGNLLYVCTPGGTVDALDAATGQLRWHFDAKENLDGVSMFACRGVSYYAMDASQRAAARHADCDARIYVATPDNKLWSVDALTGQRCVGFGTHGAVDLLTGLGAVPRGTYAVSSPPVVTHGMLVVGARVQDNLAVDMSSGVVRAYDALTGRLVWAWDVGQPQRSGAPPPGDTYTRSTPNAWAPMVADEARGLVYIPTGNPAADFWGGTRRPFDERFGASLVAVDVDTGRTRWSFQTVHHDVWDNDLSSQPVLVDLPTPQGVQPAVIVGTKQGDIYVLNRVTGKPIVPVTEIPVPTFSDVGEKLSATQPQSALSVNPGPSRLTETQMWGITPLDQMWCRIQFRKARYEGPFTPPGTATASLVYPGMFGGIEWGGVTVDPVRKILIANADAMPFIVRMARVGDPPGPVPRGLSDTRGTGFAASYYAFLSPLHIPCMQPPWGKLYAIDLTTRKILWQHPVGTVRDSGPFGIATHLPLRVGTPQVGGTIVTRGGLIFSGATLDAYLRAYDLNTGKELWKARLPAGGQATPMTYQIKGRQFVVIAAGGHAVLGTKTGDYLRAYSLGH